MTEKKRNNTAVDGQNVYSKTLLINEITWQVCIY